MSPEEDFEMGNIGKNRVGNWLIGEDWRRLNVVIIGNRRGISYRVEKQKIKGGRRDYLSVS